MHLSRLCLGRDNKHRLIQAPGAMIRRGLLAVVLSLIFSAPSLAQRAASTLPDFAALVRANKAAVVNISIDDAVTRLVNRNEGDAETDESEPSEDLSDEELN